MLSTNIPEALKQAKTPFWVIFNKAQRDRGGHPRMFQYMPTEDNQDGNMEESIAHLETVLGWMVDGKYIIKFYENEKQSKVAFFEVDFIVTGKPGGSPQANIGAAPGVGNPSIGQIVEEKVQSIMDKKRLAELEAKVIELEKQKEDPAGWKMALSNAINGIHEHAPQLIPVFAQEIMGIIKGIFGRNVLAGPPGQSHNTLENNSQMSEQNIEQIEKELERDNEKYAAVILRLRLLDPDILNTLEKMATKAEATPSIINTLKAFL